MMAVGEAMDDEVDRLESPPVHHSRARLVASVGASAVGIAVAGLALWAEHPSGSRPAAVRPLPSTTGQPAAVAPARTPFGGSVFLEPLAQCLQTDHARTLRLALQVTNLTNGRLRLVTATPVSTLPDIKVTQLRYWARPCGGVVTDQALVLPPSGHVVVAMSLDLGATCPSTHTVDARLIFDAGGRVLEAESSPLANLSQVQFVQCAGS